MDLIRRSNFAASFLGVAAAFRSLSAEISLRVVRPAATLSWWIVKALARHRNHAEPTRQKPPRGLTLKLRDVFRNRIVADITIFDPQRVIDRAMFDVPNQYPEGINYVIINGNVSVDQGQRTAALAGRCGVGLGTDAKNCSPAPQEFHSEGFILTFEPDRVFPAFHKSQPGYLLLFSSADSVRPGLVLLLHGPGVQSSQLRVYGFGQAATDST